MGQSVVLPAKHKSEIHQFVADFNTLLTAGDSIIAATYTATVTLDTGTDPSPQAILVPSPTIINNVISLGLQQGIVGCIYIIVIQFNTTLGNVVNMNARLAVIPDNYPADGAWIYYYFTSQPYPWQVTDTTHWSGSVTFCLIDTLLKFYSFGDTTHWSGSIPSCLVSNGLYPYTLIDTTHWSGAVISSNVHSTLQTYAFSDTTHWNGAIVSVTVTTVLISYNYTETTHWSGSVQSATVT